MRRLRDYARRYLLYSNLRIERATAAHTHIGLLEVRKGANKNFELELFVCLSQEPFRVRIPSRSVGRGCLPQFAADLLLY